jgi:uncharacterized membrane protein YfcA
MNIPAPVVLLIGILGGILVGLTGTSGAFLIPIMTLLFRETQVRAQGTALLIGALPIYLAPFIPYYRAHHYNLKLALLIAAGIMIGGYFGGTLAQTVSVVYLKRIFGLVLLTISLRLIFAS